MRPFGFRDRFLAAGQSASLFWFVNYPCYTGSNPPATVQNYSVPVSNGSPPDLSTNLTLTTRSELSASAGGRLVSQDFGAGTVLGQVIPLTVIYEFGNVGSSNDAMIQPAGNSSFDSSCFRLVAVDITDTPGEPTNDSDWVGMSASGGNQLYFTNLESSGTNNQVTVVYYFQVVCGSSSTGATVNPLADMGSGNQFKYTPSMGSCDSTPLRYACPTDV